MRTISAIDQFLNASIAAQEFTGAVYLIAERDELRAAGACGLAVATPSEHPARLETIFDLASLTKPLITAMLLAQLIEAGQCRLAQPISELLPEFDRPDKRAITIKQFASHSSGLPAWRPFYILAKAPDEVLSLIAQEPLAAEPGSQVIYSDLNYLSLGILLTRLAGKPLDELARQRIFAPLSLSHTGFNPPAQWRDQIAASETGNLYEERLAGELAQQFSGWRKDLIWGQVHDGNAYFLGGVAGHAGLFSNVLETHRLAQQFLPGSGLLQPQTLSLFRENFTPDCAEGRTLGWLLASPGLNGAGPALPAVSFGHAGFTGTSIWLDPINQRCYILFANRTHPEYRDFNMNERRRRFHQLAQAAFAA